MSLPTLAKTWQITANQTVTAQGTALLTDTRIIRTIKNCLVGFASNPWVCIGSSDARSGPAGGSALDGVDRWTSDSVLTSAIAGSRHAWYVAGQTGINSGFQICLDRNSTSAGLGSVVVSPSAGFTGGSDTARPTATDEIVLISAAAWASGVDTQHQIHVWQSTDGQCTRVMVWRGSTNMCTFFLFDKPQNPVSGWTNPSISVAVGSATNIVITYTTLTAGTGSRGRGTGTFTALWTGESTGGSVILPNLTDVGTTANDLSGEWPMFPIGIASTTLSHKGRHGNLFDIWWRPTSLADADTIPNDASTRRFACLGPLILPWTASSTTPLIT